ncbi:FHA domain-containing protein [Luteimonas vadosa]|uniref:FHA domain-containing protein n=1 Tax=Luteimonas vadosa TaxID=1165507 RepID=A0ABP9DXN0_9GAMM
MKLVFPGGEHPQALLGHGVNRIGSAPDASIVLDQPGVRPSHCELHVNGHGVVLQVAHGARVRVNDRDVEGLIALRAGDLLDFESIQARLAPLEAPAAAGKPNGKAPMPAAGNDEPAATAVRPAMPRYVLRGISSAGFGRTFPLLAPTTLGRAQECGIRFEHPGLSRRHCRLTPTDEGLLIEDLGSTNGCVLNDKRVDRAWAQHGDEIGIDALRFRVVKPGVDDTVEVRARSAPASAGNRGGIRKGRWVVGAALAAMAMVLAVLVRAAV